MTISGYCTKTVVKIIPETPCAVMPMHDKSCTCHEFPTTYQLWFIYSPSGSVVDCAYKDFFHSDSVHFSGDMLVVAIYIAQFGKFIDRRG